MTEMTPHSGYYQVNLVGPHGIRTHLVSKDKHCSCGGNARRQCRHIRAVKEYLRLVGERAAEGSVEMVRGQPAQGGTPGDVSYLRRFPVSPSQRLLALQQGQHSYWQWRAEQNGGAIKKFLTEPHPVKRGPFYAMSDQERDALLLRAAQRMHEGGYTPHNGKEQ